VRAPATAWHPRRALSGGLRDRWRRLRIGGCDAAELAKFGTPLYVVAEGDLRSRARAFTSAMGDGSRLRLKAFPCTAVLKVFLRRA
jgi:diaminopimelate decarboxylase